MALKPTIFKFNIALNDIDQQQYLNLNLTVAQHPSETAERMMARVLAYCLNASEGLEFASGLSTNDEPDIWQKSLDGRILKWIEVGEPSAERLRKASHTAKQVRVYSFNTKSELWWSRSAEVIRAARVHAVQFDWEGLAELATSIQRTLGLSVTIVDQSALIATDTKTIELPWRILNQP
jgi:uncharacterized protein YaeQ